MDRTEKSWARVIARRFLWIWGFVVALLLLLTVVVHVGQGALARTHAQKRAEEMMYRPEFQQAVRQALQQGMSEAQIRQQLDRYGEQEAVLIVEGMKRSARRALVLAIIGGALIYVVMTRRLKRGTRTLFVGALIVVMIFDLVQVAWKYIMVEDTRVTLGTPEVIKRLKEAPRPFRVALLTKQHPLYNMWVSGLLGKHEIEHIDVPADSRPAPDIRLIFYSDGLSPLRRWQYCNVRYVIGPRRMMEQALGALRIRGLFVPWYVWREGDEEHAVYELTNTLERVYAVGRWIIETNAEAAVAFMNGAEEALRTAVVHDPGMVTTTNGEFQSGVTIVKYTPERIEADVELSGTGLVVMATAPDPGWRVEVDGQPGKIVRCNVLHQGVIVGAGKHRVVFAFDTGHWSHTVNDWAYRLLPVLTVGTLVWLVWIRRKEKTTEDNKQEKI